MPVNSDTSTFGSKNAPSISPLIIHFGTPAPSLDPPSFFTQLYLHQGSGASPPRLPGCRDPDQIPWPTLSCPSTPCLLGGVQLLQQNAGGVGHLGGRSWSPPYRWQGPAPTSLFCGTPSEKSVRQPDQTVQYLGKLQDFTLGVPTSPSVSLGLRKTTRLSHSEHSLRTRRSPSLLTGDGEAQR